MDFPTFTISLKLRTDARSVACEPFAFIVFPLATTRRMPELPDIAVYVAALQQRVCQQYIRSVRIKSPFVLRSVDEDIANCIASPVLDVFRLGKQIVWKLPESKFIVFHLMISGRLHWRESGVVAQRKNDLLSFGFDKGTLLFTEVASKKRASLHFVNGPDALRKFDRGGLDPLECTFEEFTAVLDRENTTLKRALTDPRRFDGIGNAYSDEILAHAGLSPFLRTGQLEPEQRRRLHASCRDTLRHWLDRLLLENREAFPEKVTPFREGMLVHGRFGKPCGKCQTKVQRVVYSEREFNYCPQCQTDGRILADRSLSRLLKDEWPSASKTNDEFRRKRLTKPLVFPG